MLRRGQGLNGKETAITKQDGGGPEEEDDKGCDYMLHKYKIYSRQGVKNKKVRSGSTV